MKDSAQTRMRVQAQAPQTFSEAIKVLDGVFYDLAGHGARMERTARHFFGKSHPLDLTPDAIPAELRTGLVKCRVVYGADGVEDVSFAPYAFRVIKTAAILRDDTVDYTWKSTDRSRLNRLLADSGCDEIIIVKNGLVTDASAANIVLEDTSGALHTPLMPLLRGTKRESLLRAGIVAEREISPEDLYAAAKIRLVNAMIDLEDDITLPENLTYRL